MKANELMVGDWVMPLKKLKGIPGKVITIEGGTDICWIDSKYYSCLFLCRDFEGIPLTPEILEKNGFEKDDGGEECWGCDAGWVIPGEYDECGKEKSWQVEILGEPNSFSGTIHFVHELQHALRLCGIEKEIVL